MSSYVSTALRRLVAARADALCEYCLAHEDDAVFGCEVDHIISEKHGGATEAENLAYACAFCIGQKVVILGPSCRVQGPTSGFSIRASTAGQSTLPSTA
jgi:hypothetical protein